MIGMIPGNQRAYYLSSKKEKNIDTEAVLVGVQHRPVRACKIRVIGYSVAKNSS